MEKRIIFSLFLVLVLALSSAEETASADLEFVMVIFRHGDRTPIDPYPNDPYKDESQWFVLF